MFSSQSRRKYVFNHPRKLLNQKINYPEKPLTEITERNVSNARISYGGMAPATILANKTGQFLNGKQLNQKTLDETLEILRNEVGLKGDPPGGMAEYRTSLALSFLYKFYVSVLQSVSPKDLPVGVSSASMKLFEVTMLLIIIFFIDLFYLFISIIIFIFYYNIFYILLFFLSNFIINPINLKLFFNLIFIFIFNFIIIFIIFYFLFNYYYY